MDVFDICAFIGEAHQDIFNAQNIKAGLKRAGLWLLDANKLLCVPQPQSAANLCDILSPQHLQELCTKPKAIRTAVPGNEATFKPYGYVDTTFGEVMTSRNFMTLVTASANRRKAAKNAKRVVAQRKAVTVMH